MGLNSVDESRESIVQSRGSTNGKLTGIRPKLRGKNRGSKSGKLRDESRESRVRSRESKSGKMRGVSRESRGRSRESGVKSRKAGTSWTCLSSDFGF